MNLTESTWTEAADVETDLAVIPVGSTEQHGPHAPLGTDTLTATAIAEAGIERYDGRAVLTPAVPVGVAEEHAQFPGTLWASPETFRAYVRDIIGSTASHGWNRVVVVNGHGGNVSPLREVCGQVTRNGSIYAVPFTWFDAIDTDAIHGFDGAMGHGGPVETSLVSHLRADLIHEDEFENAAAGSARGWGEFQHGVNLAYDSAEFTESGVVGDPSNSSPEIGEQLLDAASKKLAGLLDTVANRDIDRPERRHSEE